MLSSPLPIPWSLVWEREEESIQTKPHALTEPAWHYLAFGNLRRIIFCPPLKNWVFLDFIFSFPTIKLDNRQHGINEEGKNGWSTFYTLRIWNVETCWSRFKKGGGRCRRLMEGMNQTWAQYMFIWKCPDEPPCITMLMKTFKKSFKKKTKHCHS